MAISHARFIISETIKLRSPDTLQSGVRVPAGTRGSSLLQNVQTGSGAHSSSYSVCTGSFPEAKRPGSDVDSPLSSASIYPMYKDSSTFTGQLTDTEFRRHGALCTYLLTLWNRVLLEKLTGSSPTQEIPRIFGTRSSSPYSQVPATCPYPEPTPSSPHNLLPLPEDPS